MLQKIAWKRLVKSVLLVSLALVLVFSDISDALAARSGGRIGGGGFGSPSRTSPSPGNGGARSSPGGGFGFPFILPFFGFGGGFGSIFTILIFFAIANFLVRSFQNSGFGGGNGGTATAPANPKVTVAKVQVGLLAEAQELQKELNELAQKADTGTPSGRSKVVQEASLSLLRHPEYWVYATGDTNVSRLEQAESEFNRMALSERSKYSEETLSNVESQLHRSQSQQTSAEKPSEYILVTLLVGVEGKIDFPEINNANNLRQALRQLGSASSDNLLAVEVIWTPQAEGDTLTDDDLLAAYPDLKPL